MCNIQYYTYEQMTDIFFCKLPLSTPVTQEKTGPAHTDAIGSVWSALLSFMNSLHRLRNMQGERYSNIKTNKKLCYKMFSSFSCNVPCLVSHASNSSGFSQCLNDIQVSLKSSYRYWLNNKTILENKSRRLMKWHDNDNGNFFFHSNLKRIERLNNWL